jgi:hypothetical protein
VSRSLKSLGISEERFPSVDRRELLAAVERGDEPETRRLAVRIAHEVLSSQVVTLRARGAGRWAAHDDARHRARRAIPNRAPG